MAACTEGADSWLELLYWLFKEEEGLLDEEEGRRRGTAFGLIEDVRRGGGAAKGSSSERRQSEVTSEMSTRDRQGSLERERTNQCSWF